jgi:hypothetical protein
VAAVLVGACGGPDERRPDVNVVRAAERGDAAEVTRLLEDGADVDSRDGRGGRR